MIHNLPPSPNLVDIKISAEWFPQDLREKYNDFLNTPQTKHITDIVTLLNTNIKGIEVSGFSEQFETQEQGNGYNHITFPHLGTKSWTQALSQKNVKIDFFHTDGYLTWLFLFETIQRQFSDTHANTVKDLMLVNVFNTNLQTIFRFKFQDILLGSLDNLDLSASEQSSNDMSFSLTLTYAIFNVSADLLTNKTEY